MHTYALANQREIISFHMQLLLKNANILGGDDYSNSIWRQNKFQVQMPSHFIKQFCVR